MPCLEIDEYSGVELGFLSDVMHRIDTFGVIEQDLSAYVLEIIGVDSVEMQEINLAHRGKDSTTDVLSFPLHTQNLEMGVNTCLGSVIINTELSSLVAQNQGHSLNDEITLLFVHGFLHILGYDHEVDCGEHRALEQRIIESLGLGKGLIVRELGDGLE